MQQQAAEIEKPEQQVTDRVLTQYRKSGPPLPLSKVHQTASVGWSVDMGMCQNLVPLVNIKIAGKWMFTPLKMVLIGIDPYPYWKK